MEIRFSLLNIGLVLSTAASVSASPRIASRPYTSPAVSLPTSAPQAAPTPGASATAASAPVPAASVPAANPGPTDFAAKHLLRKPAPLQHLDFSARQGFSLRMVSNEEVTAEVRNGAGRVLARGSFMVGAGDWKLHPKNLAPGLYTVLLKTGSQLRAMRMKIDDTERGPGLPEWVLEKVPT